MHGIKTLDFGLNKGFMNSYAPVGLWKEDWNWTVHSIIFKMVQFNFKIQVALGFYILLASQPQQAFSQLQNGGKDETNQNQCGGPLEGDIGSLTYPIPGQMVQPGELCVWTINLQTTKAFTFNFTNLNIDSNSECADGSVRIYSLTNLVATDKLENYTLCNENPAPGNLFLMENVAALVFYSGSNPGSETGFTLNWEGIAFNPIPSQHFNSYSTTPSGLIRFPVEGEYEPNTIATWLVKAGQIDQEINVDFNLTSLSLDTCLNVENPCVCDALILYEITDQGVLTESERFCGERTSAVKGKMSANFILAFFADFHPSNNTATGFELIYKPTVDDVTTTTTTDSPVTTSRTTKITTTVTPEPSGPCGRIIDAVVDEEGTSNEGLIIYKPSVNYEANERCVWTIRASPSYVLSKTKMEFQLAIAGFQNEKDRLVVDMFDYYRNESYTSDPHTGTLMLNGTDGVAQVGIGTVAIITFTTEGSLGQGFVLSYKITHVNTCEACDMIKTTDEINADSQGVITQANSTIGNYNLYTYVLPPANFKYTHTLRLITFQYSFLERACGGMCCDSMWVYSFTSSGFVQMYQICDDYPSDARLLEFPTDEIMLFVFKSDKTDRSDGFEIKW